MLAARLTLIGLLVAVPAFGYTVSIGVQWHLNAKVREAAREQVPDADPLRIAKLDLTELCQAAADQMRALCRTDTALTLLQKGSLATAAGGVALLVLVAAAGYVSRANRMLLLLLFRPGLYLVSLALTALIVCHAAIAIAAIYYGESALVNRIHAGLMMAIGLGALVGVYAVAKNVFSIVKKAQTNAIGTSITRDDAPELWQCIDETARKLGALRPDHVVVGLDPNFYVTEANVLSLSGALTGRTLFCSLPLARILTTREFTAIIGHELAHFRGEDTRFSEKFYPIYRGTASSISSLSQAGGDGIGALALLPALVIFNFFLEQFAVAENGHSRRRELVADDLAASVTDPRTMASALVKVHAFAPGWSVVEDLSIKALKSGQSYINSSALFANLIAKSAVPDALEGIVDSHTSHPTDSHPPLSTRLSALGVSLEDVADEALAVSPSASAQLLVPNCEQREEELSDAYQHLLAEQAGIDLAAAANEQPAVVAS